MANLKNIKNRINSVSNIQKITRAMKMVAAAKVKKSENMVKASRPFTWSLCSLFNRVYEKIGSLKFNPIETTRPLDNYPVLLSSRNVKKVCMLVISSNQGLAGSYSANIVKHTLSRIKEIRAEGRDVVLYLVGQKALAPLRNAQSSLGFEIKEIYTTVIDDPNPMNVLVVSEDLASGYVNEEFDKIELITTRYKNMMTYKVEDWTMLPIIEAKNDKDVIKKFHEEEAEFKSIYDTDMLFEPDPYSILGKLVPMFITNIIYQALLEARASELASRMTAMSAATDNAEEMISTLTVDYNKARQEKITQELTEIISGANALN